MSATTRTLKALRDSGFTVDICERFLGFAGKFGQRKDLFGLFDLIAMRPGDGIYGVQSFTTAWSEHEKLFLGPCRLSAMKWLRSGGKIELWGWRKMKVKRGGKAVRWMPRIKEVILKDGKLEIRELEVDYSA